eukprot:UN19002
MHSLLSPNSFLRAFSFVPNEISNVSRFCRDLNCKHFEENLTVIFKNYLKVIF